MPSIKATINSPSNAAELGSQALKLKLAKELVAKKKELKDAKDN